MKEVKLKFIQIFEFEKGHLSEAVLFSQTQTTRFSTKKKQDHSFLNRNIQQKLKTSGGVLEPRDQTSGLGELTTVSAS